MFSINANLINCLSRQTLNHPPNETYLPLSLSLSLSLSPHIYIILFLISYFLKVIQNHCVTKIKQPNTNQILIKLITYGIYIF